MMRNDPILDAAQTQTLCAVLFCIHRQTKSQTTCMNLTPTWLILLYAVIKLPECDSLTEIPLAAQTDSPWATLP